MDFVDGILIGSGKQSKNLCQIITLPSSPPHNVQCLQNSENQLTFKWDEPIKIAPDVEVDNYNFKLMKEDSHHEPIIEPITTEQTIKPITAEPTTIEPTTIEPTTTEPTTIEPTVTELSTESSKHPESNREDSFSIPNMPNSRLNPIPFTASPPERLQLFSTFLDFFDFISFARSKDKNMLRNTGKGKLVGSRREHLLGHNTELK